MYRNLTAMTAQKTPINWVESSTSITNVRRLGRWDVTPPAVTLPSSTT